MDMPGSLSLEQEFQLQALKSQVRGLSLDQAQGYVVEVMRQMMVKDNLVKHLLKQPDPSSVVDSVLNSGCDGTA